MSYSSNYEIYAIQNPYNTILTGIGGIIGGAATVALVSNPIGWGVGLFYLIAGACLVPTGIVNAMTPQTPQPLPPVPPPPVPTPPVLPPPVPTPPRTIDQEKAKEDLIKWLREREFLEGNNIVSELDYISLVDDYDIFSEPQFDWMTPDILLTIVKNLNYCNLQGNIPSGRYFINKNINVAISNALANICEN